MNRSKKLFLTFTGSLLFLLPLTAKSALNKSVDDFSNINISEEIKEKSKLDRSPKILIAANKKIKKRLKELELKNEDLENMLNELALKNEDLENMLNELALKNGDLEDRILEAIERHESRMH